METVLSRSMRLMFSAVSQSAWALPPKTPNKTLVLLNGRRRANNAFDSSAPDLNMIPFAALERVEVLRDGASALYGRLRAEERALHRLVKGHLPPECQP